MNAIGISKELTGIAHSKTFEELMPDAATLQVTAQKQREELGTVGQLCVLIRTCQAHCYKPTLSRSSENLRRDGSESEQDSYKIPLHNCTESYLT